MHEMVYIIFCMVLLIFFLEDKVVEMLFFVSKWKR